MSSFNATVKSPLGETRTLSREADSQAALLSALRAEGLTPVRVEEADESAGLDLSALLPGGGARKPRRKDIQSFVSNFATLLRSGMDVERALRTLERESRGPLRAVLGAVCESVRQGASLSEAMATADVFSPIHIRVIRAGEYGGNLDGALSRIAASIERENELRAKVRNAVAYPAFLICFGLLSFAVMMVFVLPRFLSIYEELNVRIPWMTSVLLKTSNVLSGYGGWLILLAMLLGGLLLRQALRFGENLTADRLRMKAPLIGRFFIEVEVAAFLRTMGLLIQSGLPVTQSLELCSKVARSAVFARAALDIEAGVQKGGKLSAEMREQELFSETVLNLVSVGEESGRLDDLLLETSEAMEKRLDELVKGLVTLLEPILILVVGTIVGLMVMAALLPIFSLSAGLRQ